MADNTTSATQVTEVAQGIYQARIPLPFALNIVNIYLLRDGDGWTVIDTGINTAAARQAWDDVFATLRFTARDIRRIILTHSHPDHFGLVGWLQHSAAPHTIPVYTSAVEADQHRRFREETSKPRFSHFLTITGMPASVLDPVAASMEDTMRMTLPDSAPLEIITAGDTLAIGSRLFQLHQGSGHSDGHLLLYDAADRLMLSGDHVLMKITPNIGYWSWMHAARDPLGEYLASLEQFRPLDIRLALPGHKALITDWAGRIDELRAHHMQRLDHARDAVAHGSHTAYDAAHRIFDVRHFTVHEWRFAVAETLAHLEYLRVRGQITRDEGSADTGSVWHYHLA